MYFQTTCTEVAPPPSFGEKYISKRSYGLFVVKNFVSFRPNTRFLMRNLRQPLIKNVSLIFSSKCSSVVFLLFDFFSTLTWKFKKKDLRGDSVWRAYLKAVMLDNGHFGKPALWCAHYLTVQYSCIMADINCVQIKRYENMFSLLFLWHSNL